MIWKRHGCNCFPSEFSAWQSSHPKSSLLWAVNRSEDLLPELVNFSSGRIVGGKRSTSISIGSDLSQEFDSFESGCRLEEYELIWWSSDESAAITGSVWIARSGSDAKSVGFAGLVAVDVWVARLNDWSTGGRWEKDQKKRFGGGNESTSQRIRTCSFSSAP